MSHIWTIDSRDKGDQENPLLPCVAGRLQGSLSWNVKHALVDDVRDFHFTFGARAGRARGQGLMLKSEPNEAIPPPPPYRQRHEGAPPHVHVCVHQAVGAPVVKLKTKSESDSFNFSFKR